MKSSRMYLVRVTRENGEIAEFEMRAPDDLVAIDNAEKSFDREFTLIENTGTEMPILEEKFNE